MCREVASPQDGWQHRLENDLAFVVAAIKALVWPAYGLLGTLADPVGVDCLLNCGRQALEQLNEVECGLNREASHKTAKVIAHPGAGGYAFNGWKSCRTTHHDWPRRF